MSINLKALDLSHHNTGPRGGPIDFGAIAAYDGGRIKGVILKATQGVAYADPTFAQRRRDAAAAGLLVGAYDFNTGDPAQQQVDNFFRVAQPDENMLCALDYEDWNASPMGLELMIEYLELADAKLGRKFWIYSGNRIKAKITQAGDDVRDFLGEHPLWLAQYGPRPKMVDVDGRPLPWVTPTLWQFSGDGVNNPGYAIPGIDIKQASQLDMNSFDGSDDDLAEAWTS